MEDVGWGEGNAQKRKSRHFSHRSSRTVRQRMSHSVTLDPELGSLGNHQSVCVVRGDGDAAELISHHSPGTLKVAGLLGSPSQTDSRGEVKNHVWKGREV